MKNPLLAKVANVIGTLLSCTLLILIVCAAAMAQGGKAEPNRIEFKRGRPVRLSTAQFAVTRKLNTFWQPGRGSG